LIKEVVLMEGEVDSGSELGRLNGEAAFLEL
jgi:hypothetical protein